MAGFARVTVGRRDRRVGRTEHGRRCASGIAAEFRRAVRAFVFFVAACYGALTFAPGSRAQAYVVTLDPAQTKVEFALDTTLHKVHGTFQLKSGQIQFDRATGKASGAIIVDARSAASDNKSRDKKMHQEILESPKYPEIVFTPQQVHGSFDPQKSSQVDVTGTFRIHGEDHDLTMTIAVQPVPGSQLQCDTQFTIPYIKWGMKDASTFLLHANDTVELEIHATAQITPDQATTH
jgi:polyisoprenoid-binding protein YceI